jgi:hypothetical protein
LVEVFSKACRECDISSGRQWKLYCAGAKAAAATLVSGHVAGKDVGELAISCGGFEQSRGCSRVPNLSLE